MVGELSAAIPCVGGFYVWVRRALGPFWGFQEAWLSLMASIFDMGAYPTVAVLYLGRVWPQTTQGNHGVYIAGGIILLCMLWNLLGARAVGDGSILLGLLLMSPFFVLAILAFARHSSSAALTFAPSCKSDLLAGILVCMWNYMGWANASTVAEEVEDPQRTYPRVMVIALVAIIFSYVVPVAAMWPAHVPANAWATGSWASFAGSIAGPWLGFAVVIGALVSTAGVFYFLTLSFSPLPLSLAGERYLPPAFCRVLSK